MCAIFWYTLRKGFRIKLLHCRFRSDTRASRDFGDVVRPSSIRSSSEQRLLTNKDAAKSMEGNGPDGMQKLAQVHVQWATDKR